MKTPPLRPERIAASIVPHPSGGYTIARLIGTGTARVYRGRYATQDAALEAALTTFKSEPQAA